MKIGIGCLARTEAKRASDTAHEVERRWVLTFFSKAGTYRAFSATPTASDTTVPFDSATPGQRIVLKLIT